MGGKLYGLPLKAQGSREDPDHYWGKNQDPGGAGNLKKRILRCAGRRQTGDPAKISCPDKPVDKKDLICEVREDLLCGLRYDPPSRI